LAQNLEIQFAGNSQSQRNESQMGNKVRVGAIQAEPVWLDLQGGVRKVTSLIEQAAKDGINVLGFPEVFIPGYPW